MEVARALRVIYNLRLLRSNLVGGSIVEAFQCGQTNNSPIERSLFSPNCIIQGKAAQLSHANDVNWAGGFYGYRRSLVLSGL